MSVKQSYIEYWLQSAKADLESMQIMFVNKQYSWTLFIGHLVIEKTLKALYIQNKDDDVPRIHDLSRLATLAEISFSDAIKYQLDTITTFNINARYTDYKIKINTICTPEYTENYKNIIEDIYQWLQTLLQHK